MELAGALRIAYVVNTWWPKIDGASIAVMGHVRHFAQEGHPVLVVRPQIRASEVLAEEARRAGFTDANVGGSADAPVSFVDFGTVPDARAGGFEIVIDPLAFREAERTLRAWLPDVLLVMDPCLFMFDAFRVPGITPPVDGSHAQPGHPARRHGAAAVATAATSASAPAFAPVTIACFTTHFVDAVRQMPDFWWIPTSAEPLLQAGVAMSYAVFDRIFVNGEPTRQYLRDTIRLGALGGISRPPIAVDGPRVPPAPREEAPTTFDLSARATVVASRGVPRDFCHAVEEEACAAVPSVARMRQQRRAGSIEMLYVGRLAYDKYVDHLLDAFAAALRALGPSSSRATPPPVTLHLVGAGELSDMARAVDALHPGSVQLHGTVAPQHVPCLLREATLYVSAAANETYGRAQVEALRCAVPLVVMATEASNMWVVNGTNGLLAADLNGLAAAIAQLATEPALVHTLRDGAAASAAHAGALSSADPNAAMLAAITAAHAEVLRDGPPHKYHWHLLWTPLFSIGRLIDRYLNRMEEDNSTKLEGFWGPVDALHTFCEPSYASSGVVCELYNAIGSLAFVVFGLLNLYRLRRMRLAIGRPLRWQATAGWYMIILVGGGSAFFHATMRYHAELLDELPMLATLSVAYMQMVGAHRWTLTPRSSLVASLSYVGSIVLLTLVYLVTRWYFLFVTTFTLGCVGLLGGFLTIGPTAAVVSRLGYRAAVLTILSRLAWEIENHLCVFWPGLWVLHNVWHIGMCFAANDLFNCVHVFREDTHDKLVPLLLCPAMRDPTLAQLSRTATRARAQSLKAKKKAL